MSSRFLAGALAVSSLAGTVLVTALPAAALQSHTSRKSPRSTRSSRRQAEQQRRRELIARRVRRIHRAFIRSAELKPMANQLLQNRSQAAYAGVEAYARRHAGQDAAALAWLVVGYAHLLDHEYGKAIEPLKRARQHAGELADYVAYFLGSAYGGTGDSAQVVATLRDFDRDYSDSLFACDAAVVYATGLLAQGSAQEAIAVLERHRQPYRSDVELALGRAYIRVSQINPAVEALRRVYFSMPLAAEADDANTELQKLSGSAALAPPTIEERKSRADLLARARRYNDAAREYRDMMDDASAAERPALQLALGLALHRDGRDKDARPLLENLPGATGGLEAQRLFILAEIARNYDDEDGFQKAVASLREQFSTSPWFENALLVGGNMYLLHRDYDRAIDYYRQLEQRFPASPRCPYAHWKVAWLNWRQGMVEEARRGLEEQIALYPDSAEVPAALYWRGRLAEEAGDPARARAYYQKLSERFRNYYYANLARQRLGQLPAGGDPVQEPLLEKIPPVSLPGSFVVSSPPADELRVQKALLLQNGGLFDLAARELQAAVPQGGATWATAQLARLYQDSGHYNLALEAVKRAVPTYFALNLSVLPRSYWETLFPRPYWSELKRYSLRNRLDPFLVASLIRQESEFNAGAVSHANAMGLMQLLPGTGRTVARELRVRHFSSSLLLVPNTNLQLGTRYFRTLVDHFNGSLEYALAAYNAGADRVEDWLANGKYRDAPEFVESIPFTETREYVQAILRNAVTYRRLYGSP